jgi:hypothetical protein
MSSSGQDWWKGRAVAFGVFFMAVRFLRLLFFDTTHFSQAWGDTTPPPTYYTQPRELLYMLYIHDPINAFA